jgi:hypothetical protein
MVDRTGWWWRQLPDDVELLEEEDGTFTLTTRPDTPGYDPETGDAVLERYPDGQVRAAVQVRRELEDTAVLTAVLAELRRRGYTITGPG